MDKIIKYKVLWMPDSYNLEKEVQSYVDAGWEPLGGLQLSATTEVNHADYGAIVRNEIWAQAIVKRLEGDTNGIKETIETGERGQSPAGLRP